MKNPPLATPAGAVIHLDDVSKVYAAASGPFSALSHVGFRAAAGEMLAVVGKSGSGKSTLLNMMTGIDRPSSGEVHVAGTAVHALKEGPLAAWRGRNVGVVFQFFQLLPNLTVAENVMLPMEFCNTYPPKERRARALMLLDRVGINDQADKLPLALSGGQQQRAAIARALANDPPLLVADEPTGNLDSRTSADVWSLLSALARSGKTVVVVTHDPDVARWVNRVITLSDGMIQSDNASGRPNSVAEVAHV
jgi:putative ABC transport system ATP-binding protein